MRIIDVLVCLAPQCVVNEFSEYPHNLVRLAQ